MSTLVIPELELVSTLRVSPKNGPPSSQDYNDSDQEKLVDLTTLALFVNNVMLPILSKLSPDAAAGITGGTVYSDPSSQETVFFNADSGTSLVIADSLRYLYAYNRNLGTQFGNLSSQVASLQAKLASTNQNDISRALQGITTNLGGVQGDIKVIYQAISNLQQMVGQSSSSQTTTPVIGASATETVAVLWSVAFSDNNYTVSYGIEDESGFLQVNNFRFLDGGAGILLSVTNTDPNATHQGTVHATGQVRSLTSIQ